MNIQLNICIFYPTLFCQYFCLKVVSTISFSLLMLYFLLSTYSFFWCSYQSHWNFINRSSILTTSHTFGTKLAYWNFQSFFLQFLKLHHYHFSTDHLRILILLYMRIILIMNLIWLQYGGRPLRPFPWLFWLISTISSQYF